MGVSDSTAASPPDIRLRRSYAAILRDALTEYTRYHFERARACWAVVNDPATPETVGTAYRNAAAEHEQSRQAIVDLNTRLREWLDDTPRRISVEDEPMFTLDPTTLHDRALCQAELQALYIRVHRAADLPVSEDETAELDLNVLARAIPHYASIYQLQWEHLF